MLRTVGADAGGLARAGDLLRGRTAWSRRDLSRGAEVEQVPGARDAVFGVSVGGTLENIFWSFRGSTAIAQLMNLSGKRMGIIPTPGPSRVESGTGSSGLNAVAAQFSTAFRMFRISWSQRQLST